MIKIKEFVEGESSIEEQINKFIKENDIDIVDIKYTVVCDKPFGLISFALLVYKIYEEEE